MSRVHVAGLVPGQTAISAFEFLWEAMCSGSSGSQAPITSKSTALQKRRVWELQVAASNEGFRHRPQAPSKLRKCQSDLRQSIISVTQTEVGWREPPDCESTCDLQPSFDEKENPGCSSQHRLLIRAQRFQSSATASSSCWNVKTS